MLIKSNINAYILAGGLSRRFGSNKAIYKINGVTFLDKIFTTLQSNFTNIFTTIIKYCIVYYLIPFHCHPI